MTQLSLFDDGPRTPHPRDPNVDVQDVPRLTGQNALVLDALREGPKTNKQLAFLSLKYTSRISDIRAAGYDVYIVERNHKTGLTLYALRTP